MRAYTSGRDYRFHYAEEATAFIEERQCRGCVHAEPIDEDLPGGSCPVLVAITLEDTCENILEPGIEVEDLGVDGIWCTRAEY